MGEPMGRADGFLMASLWWADGFQGEWAAARSVAADPATCIISRLARTMPDADSVPRSGSAHSSSAGPTHAPTHAPTHGFQAPSRCWLPGAADLATI
jgi:hypothetical protein